MPAQHLELLSFPLLSFYLHLFLFRLSYVSSSLVPFSRREWKTRNGQVGYTKHIRLYGTSANWPVSFCLFFFLLLFGVRASDINPNPPFFSRFRDEGGRILSRGGRGRDASSLLAKLSHQKSLEIVLWIPGSLSALSDPRGWPHGINLRDDEGRIIRAIVPSSGCSFQIVSFFLGTIFLCFPSLSCMRGLTRGTKRITRHELGGRDPEYLEPSTAIPGIGTIRLWNSAKGTRVTILLASRQPAR